MPEQCRDPTTLIVGASLAAVVALLIVITVVVVVVTLSCCYNRKRRIKQAEKSLDFFKEQYDKTDNTELKRDLLEKITQVTTQLLGLSSVRPDSEEEWNEEIEKERDDQVLILLKEILKKGKRNSKQEPDIILKTVMEEVGSKIKEFE